MRERTIVLVSDLDDPNRGEINLLESPEEAARLVESLLESGYDAERIRAFSADELAMQVSHKPVVSLGAADQSAAREETASAATAPSDNHVKSETVEVASEVTAEIASGVASPPSPETTEGEEVPYVKNGVRFSTLFRPA